VRFAKRMVCQIHGRGEEMQPINLILKLFFLFELKLREDVKGHPSGRGKGNF
jgi:hypothetical protein